MNVTPQPIAVFDFDHTLIRDDSFFAFLILLTGRVRTGLALLAVAASFAGRWVEDKNDPALADYNTYFKAGLLQRLIAGKTVESLRDPIARLRQALRWNEPVLAELMEHYEQGHHIVIASGALDLYMPELIKDLPHHALLCTSVEVKEAIVTGAMYLGNCVRQGKADRVTRYLADHGPFGESFGYGNYPDDVPMLNLMKHRVIV